MKADGKKIIIIGGGASGLMAAIAAGRCGASVTVLEAMKKPGRKLLLTGNGRCNLTNLDPELASRYRSVADGAFCAASRAEPVIRQFPAADTLRFFEEIGVAARAQDELVYPCSGQASTVLEALLAEAERLNVTLKYNSKVTALSRDGRKGSYLVKVGDWTYEAGRVVLCCGSKAAPATGSDGSGYALARALGHTVTEIVPALTGFICRDAKLRTASGARTRARAQLYSRDGALLADETGEIQWTDYGISGIAVFQLSRYAKELSAGDEMTVRLDLVPDRSEESVIAALGKMEAHMGMSSPLCEADRRKLLSGFVHDRVAAFLCAGSPNARTGSGLAGLLKNVSLTVSGLRGYEHAQLCAGGIPLRETDPETLESRISPGLFFAGEMLDVDGPCGGYNLQWAWSSGCAAGRAAAHSAGFN